MYNNSYYGNFRNRKFTDIWESFDDFADDIEDSELQIPFANQNSVKNVFYLLYGQYGNSVVASDDEEQFKYQIFSTIFMYGPTWEKRLDIQSKLRGLTDAELEQGTKTIYNKALNPGNSPTTDELTFINEQNTANIKRSKLDKYTELYSILDNDVTKEFLDKFKKYFLQVVIPEKPLWYYTEVNEENE